MVTNSSCSTRYNRRSETQNVLEHIHGGAVGSLFGAWDFVAKFASKDLIEKFVLEYKKGKFIEKLYGNFTSAYYKSDQAMNQSIAAKYAGHLSRRKFNFFGKIQKSTFDPDTQQWGQKNINYGGKVIKLFERTLSDNAVQKFICSLDIGDIHPIPGFCGVTRTVTALTTMMLDLHLSVPSLFQKLLWFNDEKNHFVIEFSDDGAPESKYTTMSIGSLTLWNVGSRVRSREYHYILHSISCGEKEEVLADLW